ncbi:FUSC family protein [Actinoplanes hulinensis]|uniref:FUSC family protein n=1 Tax=Actinoplanes hulinensis TaxID=1144547 RepID=A0ABS7B2H2_9ACTN|nr:aromatic acid exporter family protein [Actinoplanes hulinensis]MBW6435227.1 FUSC family protein [Actinoplanes hulinensis]
MLRSLTAALDPITLVVTGLVLCALVVTLLRRTVRPVVEDACRTALDRMRPHLPAGLLRLAGRVEPSTVREILVTTLAAGIAWNAADMLHLVGPVTAAIIATLSVQMSSHASLRAGAQRLIGTVAGIALSVAAWGVFGLSAWSIAVIAGLGLAVGRVLRLGDASVLVPLTSLGILVGGTAVTEAFVWERVAATALGIVVGVILSPLVGGMTPLERARVKATQLSTEIARLLRRLGDGVQDGYDREQAEQWLARSRELDEDLGDAIAAVEELTKQARWSLTTPVAKVTPLDERVRALEHGVHQLNSVARSMFDAAATSHTPAVPKRLGQVLIAVSEAFEAHASDAGKLEQVLNDLRETRQRTLRQVRTEIDDTGVLVLTGSIMTDIERMAGGLERSAPALAVGVRAHGPAVPAVSEVLPAVRMIWEKTVTTRADR